MDLFSYLLGKKKGESEVIDTTDIREVINMTDANITSGTPFSSYPQDLYEGYINVLKDKYTLIDNMNKGTSTGETTDSANLLIYEGILTKESAQETTTRKNLFCTNNDDYDVSTAYRMKNLNTGSDLLTISFIEKDPTIDLSGINLGFCLTSTPNDGYVWIINNGTFTSYIHNTTTSGSNIGENGEYLMVYPNSNYAFNLIKSKYDIQIEVGSTATSYEPYTGAIPAPNPSYPEDINVVTGDIDITVSNSDNTETETYQISLGTNEIVGIGNVKDELVIDKEGKCYINKKIGKAVLNGTEAWTNKNITDDNFLFSTYKIDGLFNTSDLSNLKSNYFTVNSSLWENDVEGIALYNLSASLRLRIDKTLLSDISTPENAISSFKTWLSTHNTIVYYPLAEPTVIDLEQTVDITTYDGITSITNSEDMDMNITYIKNIYN